MRNCYMKYTFKGSLLFVLCYYGFRCDTTCSDRLGPQGTQEVGETMQNNCRTAILYTPLCYIITSAYRHLFIVYYSITYIECRIIYWVALPPTAKNIAESVSIFNLIDI